MHNATVVLMGGRGSNIADITNENGDPGVFVAGLAVRKATTGALQLADDGSAPLIGVSIGSSLSGDNTRTAVARTGTWIPIRLKDDEADFAFVTLGGPVLIDDTTGEASVDGDATGATYLSGVLTGLYPDGTECKAAFIALSGGF